MTIGRSGECSSASSTSAAPPIHRRARGGVPAKRPDPCLQPLQTSGWSIHAIADTAAPLVELTATRQVVPQAAEWKSTAVDIRLQPVSKRLHLLYVSRAQIGHNQGTDATPNSVRANGEQRLPLSAQTCSRRHHGRDGSSADVHLLPFALVHQGCVRGQKPLSEATFGLVAGVGFEPT